MNPVAEKNLDEAILRVLDERDSSFGLNATAIKHLIVGAGFPHTEEAVIQRRLDYLFHDQIGFVCTVGSGDFHAHLRFWRISPRGTNHLRAQGL